MKKKSKLFLLFLLITVSLFSQEKPADEFSLKLSGYVKTDVFYDTQQSVTAREGHLYLYPAPELKDANGNDLNSETSFNFLSVQSRINVTASGTEALGAKIKGVIEADFFGNADTDVNGFRLRHAYVTLTWDKTSLLVGQYWIPMMIVESCPGTVSFNTGAPFQPFGRNPQIRLSQSAGNFKFIVAASSQRDIPSPGPDGASSAYLRNSNMPIWDAHIQYAQNGFFAGAGTNFKMIKPRVKTSLNLETNSTVKSLSFMAYGKYETGLFSLKAETIYGENMSDYLLLGGYAVKNINSATDEHEYCNIRAVSGWTDISYGKDLSFGIFAGYSKNLGSPSNIKGAIYSRGSDINYIYRVSPRIIFNTGNIQAAFETEHTCAAYGKLNKKGKVYDNIPVSNTRFIAAFYYFF